jgi:hypothetical protein
LGARSKKARWVCGPWFSEISNISTDLTPSVSEIRAPKDTVPLNPSTALTSISKNSKRDSTIQKRPLEQYFKDLE